MTSRRNVPAYAIVTGPTSGIGHAFANELAKDGVNLILVSRDETRLEEVKAELEEKYSVTAKVIRKDLSRPEAPSEIFDVLKQEGLQPNILVNNAGYNVYGRFEESNLEQELKMIQLQIGSLTEMTKLFLRQRDKAAENKILNVASIAGLVPGPRASVHFASRAHVLSFSLAIAEEFRGTDVSVTCLCPGPVRTDFYNRASMVDVRLASGRPIRLMDPETVAAIGYDAMKKRKIMIVAGFHNKVWGFLAKHAPNAIAARFMRWILDRC